MKERHCCVIDAAQKYVTFVLVQNVERPQKDGSTVEAEEILHYKLKDGETLIDAMPPVQRQHAGQTGFLAPVWDGEAWSETATADEIEAWEQGHPTPEVPPAPMSNAELEAENKLLKAQIAAQSDRADFVEDCIAEMAMQVYNN